MFKAVLCLVIIGASGMLGLLKAGTYRQRVQELNDLRDMFLMLRTEISYMKDPLPQVFGRIGSSKNNVAGSILTDCSLLMEKNRDIQSCWTGAVEKASINSCLTDEDIGIIKDLGSRLGRSDVKGQAELLQMADEKLMLQLREAETLKNTKGKMYAGLGFSIGIVVAIMMI